MKMIRELGSGSYGVVALVEDQFGDQIALKTFNNAPRGQDLGDLLMREVTALRELAHPCVLEIVGYWLPAGQNKAQIGTKYAGNGSLRDALDDCKEGRPGVFIDDTGKAIIIAGIVLGMKFIHSRGFMHRDLKPANILLDDRGWPKIGDLGSSKFVDLGLSSTMNVGTPYYQAPEMCGYEYNEAVDVYAFALILYEILRGKYIFDLPIDELGLRKKVATGVRPPLPDWMNSTVREIITRGWEVNPTLRPTIESVWNLLEGIGFGIAGKVKSKQVQGFVLMIEAEEEKISAKVPAR
jgi:serine/threonine-protein kinase